MLESFPMAGLNTSDHLPAKFGIHTGTWLLHRMEYKEMGSSHKLTGSRPSNVTAWMGEYLSEMKSKMVPFLSSYNNTKQECCIYEEKARL